MNKFRGLRKLYSSLSQQTTWHLNNVLSIQGFVTFVHNEHLSDIVLPRMIAPYEIWVTENQFQDALIALNQAMSVDPSSLDPWECSNCHESIGGQFTDCWNCGVGKDSH